MRLLWIGILALLLASLALLISSGRGTILMLRSWAEASNVIPETRLAEFRQASALFTSRLLGSMPQGFREKVTQKLWSAVALMIFRLLVLLHLAPALLLPFFVGLLEGWWARENQKSLIKIHSPMRFSLALAGLGFIPIMALLWVTAPMAVPALLLVLLIALFEIFNTRNVIVHAPTQF